MPKITKSFLATLEPSGRTLVHWDSITKGFGVRVYPSGEIAYIARYRVKGDRKQRFVVIGRPADTALDAARARATEYIAAARDGRDLADELIEKVQAAKAAKEALAARITVAEAARQYQQAFALSEAGDARERAPASLRAEAAWVGHLTDAYGDRALADITAADVTKVYKARKTGSQRAVYGAIHRMLNWASAADGPKFIEANPCAGMARPKRPKMRTKTPKPEDVLTFITDIERLVGDGVMSETGGDYLTLCALLAQRRSEVGRMKWEDINIRAREWVQPPESNKARREHTVPLAPRAMAIIEKRRAAVLAAGGKLTGYVLPGRYSPSIAGNAKTLMEQMRRETDVDFRLHDLRRAAVTAMATAGVAESVADLLLNHAASQTRAGVMANYQHATHDAPKRRAMEIWEAAIFGEAGGKVLPFKASA